MNRFYSTDSARQVLHKIQNSGLPTAYDYEKHRIIVLDKTGTELIYFRLPLTLPALNKAAVEEQSGVKYIMLLIQAGNCAMGYFEGGINMDHKVFRSYMVRKKQGKSQIKYLKTKGKSRAGSRVRLGETVEFFENINGRLQEYFENGRIDRIAISCSKTLIPFLFNAKVSTPFDKRDERIYKIPKHIHTPIYEVMMDAHKFLLKGELIYEESQQELVNTLLGSAGAPEDED